jgi:hypothetical protein
MTYDEVSIVLNPAYDQTEINARARALDAQAFDEFRILEGVETLAPVPGAHDPRRPPMNDVWTRLFAAEQPSWLDEIRQHAPACEALRPLTRKPKSTGTISEAACLCLRAVVARVRPSVCVEIGTFIGTSALVLAAAGACVFTCDKDNGAFESQGTITAYGRTRSTTMLDDLVRQRVRGDLLFFDGRIQMEDLPLLAEIATPHAVYAFDDYEGHEKGVMNVARLRPQLPRGYQLVEPTGAVPGADGRSTIALLVPPSFR